MRHGFDEDAGTMGQASRPRLGWDEPLKELGCGARNVLKRTGDEWVPEAPGDCWLLPASDEVAVQIAQQQDRLRKLGWRLLSSEAAVVVRLGNKALLRDFAEQRGLLEHLPAHYASPQTRASHAS
ncbi:unnamed protein product [Prorocentrum cordatum]|uniref:Uncharacterized protein n=1 Tax=Prorocentrum cordatum TaxID=2364126 RepID=A0ABN9YC58_9DINO|nr:unnamed protein product [Polarella glacialis]